MRFDEVELSCWDFDGFRRSLKVLYQNKPVNTEEKHGIDEVKTGGIPVVGRHTGSLERTTYCVLKMVDCESGETGASEWRYV